MDLRIDLHEVLEGFVTDLGAHQRADDAERGRAFEAERIADRHDNVAKHTWSELPIAIEGSAPRR
jgi:hypothetical protein